MLTENKVINQKTPEVNKFQKHIISKAQSRCQRASLIKQYVS